MYKDNITLFFKEKDKNSNNKNINENTNENENENTNENTNEFDIEKLIEEFENLNTISNNNLQKLEQQHYFFLNNNNNSEETLNVLTVNQLLKICEYYSLLKNVKMAKYKKIEIINAIKLFEMDTNNILIVTKRKKLWNYMNELSNDNIMKKYVIW
jgi:hypothetical protein